MLDTIDKNCKTALSEQVSKKLIAEIRSGKIKPGRRMPGERRLAERFGISRGTVIEALDLLESQNYIERIPAKGTFVADDINHELSLVKIAFPFPEKSISPTSLGSMENWGTVSEIYRGMIEEARKYNAEVSFMHFEEAQTDVQLTRQLRRLENFDATIFIGFLLSKLQQEVMKTGKFCLSVAGAPPLNADSFIISDLKHAFKELAGLANSKSYKKLKVISLADKFKPQADREGFQGKLATLEEAFKKTEIEVNKDWQYEININSTDLKKLLDDKNIDLRNGTELIYLSNSKLVPLLYQYCFDHNIKLGENLGVFGYANGITFTNLIPSFTYCKINHFEMGRRACAKCVEAIRHNRTTDKVESVKNTLVTGKTI